jgi:hypothetical protein
MGEKLSKVALEAADKSTEISSKWTKDTLAKLGDVTAAKDEPTDYTKAMTDFASAQAEMAAETMAAFAEVAKKVQMETVELMMAAGKECHRRRDRRRQEGHRRGDRRRQESRREVSRQASMVSCRRPPCRHDPQGRALARPFVCAAFRRRGIAFLCA